MSPHTIEMLPDSQAPRASWAAVSLAVVITLALFLIIPLSKLFTPMPKADVTVREINMTAPPPPKSPPPPVDVNDEPPPEPDYEPPVPELSLQQLSIALEPGVGDALDMGVSMGSFHTDIDVVQQMKRIFTFEELEASPQITYVPQVHFPAHLKRSGLTRGTVEMMILIDERGHVRVERVISSTDPAFEALARSVAERSRFSVTKMNGQAVKVRGRWPLTIQQ